MSPSALSLRFGPDVSQTVRRRIDYAFRVFCATFGFVPEPSAQVRLCYGVSAERPGDVTLAAGYRAGELSQPAPAPTWVPLPEGLRYQLASRFPCFCAVEGEDRPDWLGEIFQWISASHEHAVTESDAVGRIPYWATLHGKFGLDPTVPYASVAMHFLNAQIREVVEDWPAEPTPPWSGPPPWAVAATHDVDVFPVSIAGTLWRYLKNLGIACLVHKDVRLAGSILRHAARAIGGGPSLFNCLRRLREEEARRGMSSTFLFLCRRAHPRDANYDVSHPKVLQSLREIAQSGGEIAVHGSYTSLDEKRRLHEEFDRIARAGFPSVGHRQHWLRYRGASLFEALVEAGAWYDGSAGYPERPGFRHGLCSPFPPYDFEREAPFALLELPLAIMDGALYCEDPSGRTWRERCETILGSSRELGWGGISVLWHDALFSGAQLPMDLANLYWKLPEPGDLWTTGRDLIERIWPRFAQAGLVPESPPSPNALNPPAASA